MNLSIRGGRIIDPARKIDRRGSLYISNGYIVGLFRPPAGFHADRIIQARGLWVLPGLVDLSARLHGHGLSLESSLPIELGAASRGGITTLCCPPDSDPIMDRPSVVDSIRQRCKKLRRAEVYCLGAMTQGLGGEKLTEMAALKKSGCIGISNAFADTGNARMLRHCMEYAKSCDMMMMLFAEDAALQNRGVLHEGVVSTRLGLPAVPETAETVAVSQALLLAEQTGVRLHFCRLSAARSVALLRHAQQQGLCVTADVGICHLMLSETDAEAFNSHCHLRPPLRTGQDRDALQQGLEEGIITAICSDHQPHDADAKARPFSLTIPGGSTIESVLALAMRLVAQGRLARSTVLAALGCGPAAVLGLDNIGTLRPGTPADLCLYDPEKTATVDAETLYSQGKNTPFQGWSLSGQVMMTLYRGQPVYRR